MEAGKILSKGAKVPGFRAGKAPSFLSSRDIPQERLLRKGLELLEPFLNSKAIEALKEEKLHFNSQPRFEVKELVPSRIEVSLAFPFFPTFPIPDFSSKEGVKVGDVQLTREDVVVSALNIAKPLALPLESESADVVLLHDVVSIDFEVGLTDDEGKDHDPSDGSIEIVIGSGMLLPVVEREIVGMKLNSEGRFSITFPEFYPKLDFRNKPGYFKVKINGIKRSRAPKIGEADLPKLGFKEGTSLSEFNFQVERVSQASKVDLVRNIFRRDLLAAYLPSIDIRLSEYQILTNQRYMLERFLSGLESNGITLEEYLRDTGGSKESIFEELRGETIKSLKTQALLERLIDTLSLRVSDEEVESYLNLLTSFYKRDRAEIERTFSRDHLTSLIIDQKLLNHLMRLCDPEGAKRLEEVDYFALSKPTEEARTPLEARHSEGQSLFNLYPLEEQVS